VPSILGTLQPVLSALADVVRTIFEVITNLGNPLSVTLFCLSDRFLSLSALQLPTLANYVRFSGTVRRHRSWLTISNPDLFLLARWRLIAEMGYAVLIGPLVDLAIHWERENEKKGDE